MNVHFGLTFQSLEKVDMETGSLTGYFWPNIEWKDEFLTWNSSYEQVWYFHPKYYNVMNISRLLISG